MRRHLQLTCVHMLGGVIPVLLSRDILLPFPSHREATIILSSKLSEGNEFFWDKFSVPSETVNRPSRVQS